MSTSPASLIALAAALGACGSTKPAEKPVVVSDDGDLHPTCDDGEHDSDGHCCPNGASWSEDDMACSGDPDAADTPSLAPGTRVRRGPDWNRGDEDKGGLGTVLRSYAGDLSYVVMWDHGAMDTYRFGEDDAHDLEVV